MHWPHPARTVALTAGVLSLALGACDEAKKPLAYDSAQPTPRPSGAGPGDGPGYVYAVTRFYLGSYTREGDYSPDAWEELGFDLDHRLDRTEWKGHCLPVGDAEPINVHTDGRRGIDNGLGRWLLPILNDFNISWGGGEPRYESSWDAHAEASIAAHDATLMIWLSNLGAATDYDPVDAFTFVGRGGAEEAWGVAPESVDARPRVTVDAMLSSGRTRFRSSYLNDGVWVSGEPDPAPLLLLELVRDGSPLVLPIRRPVISMRVAHDRDSATDGTIGGVIHAEDLETVVGDFLASRPDLCDSPELVALSLDLASQGLDIMRDGTQRPDVPCDAMSVGIGFEATRVTVDGFGPPRPSATACVE